MITILTRKNNKSCRAFTLVEVMYSMTILMIALGSITATFMAFAKSSVSVGEYVDMSYQSRKALEIFSRDVRGADGINVISPISSGGAVYSNRGMDLTFPDYYGNKTVQYRYDSLTGSLRRTENYKGTVSQSDLLTGVRQFKIQFFKAPGSNFQSEPGAAGSVSLWAKSLQLDAELLRTVLAIDNTDYIISARFMMRNMN